MILAIDPGTEKTGWALMDGKDIRNSGVSENSQLLKDLLTSFDFSANVKHLAYEMIASYGMPVGKEVFETCLWIGRFVQSFGADDTTAVYRKDVKMHLCGTPRAKDSNIRQAILDMYEPTGGGATPQIGTKAKPGPLFGVSTHVWPAIGVGLTFQGISR